MIRVVLADDQALIRAGFRVLLDSAEDIEVVGEADNGAQAVTIARDRLADVVLMTSACRRWMDSRRHAGWPPTRTWPGSRS